MAPDVYRKLRASCIRALQHHFNFVSVPPGDPEKLDFGDVDIMAFDPIAHETPSSEGFEWNRCRACHHKWAISQLCSASRKTVVWSTHDGAADCGEPSHYHQVDLTILKTRPLWGSLKFYHSYEDLGLILTLLCKPYGLAYSQGGLKVRGAPYRR